MFNIDIIPKVYTFRKAAGTSRGVYHTRKVYYLRLTNTDEPGRTGWGECAPLPGLSIDHNSNYEKTLYFFCKNLLENPEPFTSFSPTSHYLFSLSAYPSILFGIETMLRHYERQSWKLWDTPFSRGEKGIFINGLIWMGSYKSMLEQVEEKINKGYKCVKLKIGAIDFEQEIDLIKHIRRHFSAREIEIRVDANGAFSPKEAMGKLEQLANLDIHSIEQPIASGQTDAMSKLCEATPLPIALDEELIGTFDKEQKHQLIQEISPQYIILKPTLHGGWAGTKQWIDTAKSQGTGWWITSALESNVGLNAIAQGCASLQTTIPQGLGTGLLYTENISLPLEIRKDKLWFNPSKAENISVF